MTPATCEIVPRPTTTKKATFVTSCILQEGLPFPPAINRKNNQKWLLGPFRALPMVDHCVLSTVNREIFASVLFSRMHYQTRT
jgi:hypothetical protein